MTLSSIPSNRPSFRLAPLAACLSAALALGSVPLAVLGDTLTVQNCGDGGPGSGSLRDKVSIAGSGDTIDLSQLPTLCGMVDSTITLSSGEIVVAQDDLILQGPDPSAGSVAISPVAYSWYRVFNHTGLGTLIVNELTVQNGYHQGGGNPGLGGCIKSNGDVALGHSTVKNCSARGSLALGGGIMTYGSLLLVDSTVSGNHVWGAPGYGIGGGVYANGALTIKYSTLSANGATTLGGGAYADGGGLVSIHRSTIEGNTARKCAGAALYGAGVAITNSTISGNAAMEVVGGACIGTPSAEISNSTIAFNADTAFPSYGSGLKIRAWGSLTLQSSIIAKNRTGAGYLDLFLVPFPGVSISGTSNLIGHADAMLPPGVITLTSDPQLGPLQMNGGTTPTHALLPGSPAIGQGNNTAGLTTDQRGPGYSRMTGGNGPTDIGALQFDPIFVDGFE